MFRMSDSSDDHKPHRGRRFLNFVTGRAKSADPSLASSPSNPGSLQSRTKVPSGTATHNNKDEGTLPSATTHQPTDTGKIPDDDSIPSAPVPDISLLKTPGDSVDTTTKRSPAMPPANPVTSNAATNQLPGTNAGNANAPNIQANIPDDEKVDLRGARDALWKRAYNALEERDPDLFIAYETLAKASSSIKASSLGPDDISGVATKQQEIMEKKQWTYTLFGRPHTIRNTVEGVVAVMNQASGLISAGMTMAPPYVSLPWSMVAILIPFTANEINATQAAVDGFGEATSLMASYNFAEEDLLSHKVTSEDYANTVLDLYTAIFKYQALTALYFAKDTLRRFGCSLKPKQPLDEALEEARGAEKWCRSKVHDLGQRLINNGILKMSLDLQKGLQLMDQCIATYNKRQRIFEWISPIDQVYDHLQIRKPLGKSYTASGRWIFEDQQNFQPWRESKKGVLLLRGVVGSGKSCLTSMVAQEFAGNSREHVAFFYCSANATATNPELTIHNVCENIMRSLLAQCSLSKDGAVSKVVENAFDTSDHQGPGKCNLDIAEKLKEVLQKDPNSRFVFIIDALDECAELADLFDTLTDLYQSCNLRIFMSSRFGVDIPRTFPSYEKIDLDDQNSADINEYIDSEVLNRYKDCGFKKKQAEKLKTTLKKQAEGVFRWVALEIEYFLPRSGLQGIRQQEGDIKRKIKRLEKQEASNDTKVERLYKAYELIYQAAVGSQDDVDRRKIVSIALTWVLCSYEPVLANDVAFIAYLNLHPNQFRPPAGWGSDEIELCIRAPMYEEDGEAKQNDEHHDDSDDDDDNDDDDEEEENTDDDEPDKEIENRAEETAEPQNESENDPLEQMKKDLLAYCSNFLVETSKGELRVAHLSVKQFLESRMELKFAPALRHLNVAMHCIALRTLVGLYEKQVSHDELESRWNSYKYLLKYWPMQCRAAQTSISLTKLLETIKVSSTSAADLDVIRLKIARKSDLCEKDRLGNTILHNFIRSKVGIEPIQLLIRADVLVDKSRLIKSKNNSGDIPLHTAAYMGHISAYAALVHAKSDVSSLNNNGMTPLQAAALFDRREILDSAALLGLNFTLPDADNNTLLHYAYIYRMSNVVSMLKRTGVAEASLNKEGISVSISQGLVQSNNLVNKDVFDNFKSLISMEDSLQREVAENNVPEQPAGPNLDRPQVIFDQTCTICDLGKWLEGSKHRLRYSLSRKLLDAGSAKSDCKLCRWLSSIVRDGDISNIKEELEVWATLDTDSAVEEGRDLLHIRVPGCEQIQIEICIDAEADEKVYPEAAIFKGRTLATTYRMESAKENLQRWLTSCRRHHSLCEETGSLAEFPTRVVDLGPPGKELRPRLREPPPGFIDSHKFVFMSYLWGTVPQFMLTSENWDSLQKVIDFKDIALLHQQAFSLLHSLGYQYVFLDALCVMFGDNLAANRELLRLSKYIESADLVLAATTNNPAEALIGEDPGKNETIRLEARMQDNEARSFNVTLRKPLRSVAEVVQHDVANRGWRIQEALLARRLVVFGWDQIYWTCLHCTRSEGNPSPIYSSETLKFSTLRAQLEARSAKDEREVVLQLLRKQWYTIVETASRGKFTYEGDRLLGIDSFAATWDTYKEEYISDVGIWRNDLVQGLLWIHNCDPFEPQGYGAGGRPSWSWAHMGLPVTHPFSGGLELSRWLGTENEFRCIEAGSKLHIQAPSIRATASDLCRKFQYFFDIRHHQDMNWVDWSDDFDSFVLVIVAPWAYRPSLGKLVAKWVGLVLQESNGALTRRGVFIGPEVGSDLTEWVIGECFIV